MYPVPLEWLEDYRMFLELQLETAEDNGDEGVISESIERIAAIDHVLTSKFES